MRYDRVRVTAVLRMYIHICIDLSTPIVTLDWLTCCAADTDSKNTSSFVGILSFRFYRSYVSYTIDLVSCIVKSDIDYYYVWVLHCLSVIVCSLFVLHWFEVFSFFLLFSFCVTPFLVSSCGPVFNASLVQKPVIPSSMLPTWKTRESDYQVQSANKMK